MTEKPQWTHAIEADNPGHSKFEERMLPVSATVEAGSFLKAEATVPEVLVLGPDDPNQKPLDFLSDSTKIPARTEVTVIPADEPKRLTLGWTVQEYNGVEVYKIDRKAIRVIEEQLVHQHDIQEGVELAVPSLMGGYHAMKVTRDGYGKLFAESAGLVAILEFAKDDRQCWICIGLVNTRGLKGLSITKDTP